MPTYTHVGWRPYTGHYAVTADAIRTPGKIHALNPIPGRRGQYKGLCGTTVSRGSDDHFQHDDGPNIVVAGPGSRITCKLCLSLRPEIGPPETRAEYRLMYEHEGQIGCWNAAPTYELAGHWENYLKEEKGATRTWIERVEVTVIH